MSRNQPTNQPTNHTASLSDVYVNVASDSGSATATISKASIKLLFAIDESNNRPSVSLISTSIDLGDLGTMMKMTQ